MAWQIFFPKNSSRQFRRSKPRESSMQRSCRRLGFVRPATKHNDNEPFDRVAASNKLVSRRQGARNLGTVIPKPIHRRCDLLHETNQERSFTFFRMWRAELRYHIPATTAPIRPIPPVRRVGGLGRRLVTCVDLTKRKTSHFQIDEARSMNGWQLIL